MLAGVFKFFGDLLTFVGPLCIARIITYVEEMRAENGEPRTLPQVRVCIKACSHRTKANTNVETNFFIHICHFFYFKFDFELVGTLVFPRSVSLFVNIPQSLTILSDRECDVTDM